MAAHQAPPSLGFSRKEYWSGLPFPSPMHEGEKWKWSCSVMSDSERPHGLQPTGLLRPWDFPGKSTEVGCHRLLCNFNTRISLTTYLTEWLICCESLNFSNNCAIVEKYKGLFSFFLELFLHRLPVAKWATTSLGSSSFSVLSFCFFILFMVFSRQKYWSGMPLPSPVGTQ